MSSNEFIDKEAFDDKKQKEAKKSSAKKKKEEKPSGRLFAQIMNGDFLSKDNFVTNLPFVFFMAFLLVVMIGWGYYAETVTKEGVVLQNELDELEAEYFTLNSEYNKRISRPTITGRLKGTGLRESLTSPRKIRVHRYIFN